MTDLYLLEDLVQWQIAREKPKPADVVVVSHAEPEQAKAETTVAKKKQPSLKTREYMTQTESVVVMGVADHKKLVQRSKEQMSIAKKATQLAKELAASQKTIENIQKSAEKETRNAA